MQGPVPHSVEIERAVLGNLLAYPSKAAEQLQMLQVAFFYPGAHRDLLAAISRLVRANARPDVSSVAAESGQAVSLLEAIAREAQPFSRVQHVKRLQELAALRALIELAGHVQERAGSDSDPWEICEQAGRELSAIVTGRGDGVHHVAPVAAEVMQRIRERAERYAQGRARENLGVVTGVEELDWLTHGFDAGQLVVIAGLPGGGKTALAVQAAIVNALDNGSSMVVNLEMSRHELVERMVVYRSHVDSRRVRIGDMRSGDLERAQLAADRVSQTALYVEDNAFSVTEIASRARAWRVSTRGKRGCLVVDYLQLVQSSAYGEARYRQVADIAGSLRRLAGELEVPVIALSQYSKGVGKDPNREPTISDLYESAAIEQAAHKIILVHNVPMADGTAAPDSTLILGKNRGGATGKVRARFVRERYAFEDWSQGGDDAQSA